MKELESSITPHEALFLSVHMIMQIFSMIAEQAKKKAEEEVIGPEDLRVGTGTLRGPNPDAWRCGSSDGSIR